MNTFGSKLTEALQKVDAHEKRIRQEGVNDGLMTGLAIGLIVMLVPAGMTFILTGSFTASVLAYAPAALIMAAIIVNSMKN